ncbi:phage tail assembly protein [Dethiosulfatarculus sandiegensis]|uniref:Phage tail assembly protein n=1 Tax=Dethiosulfatarculus sandiegensis TaxID=1429043 RepID=A0A0D2HN99_9BACT|nr:phage tail assembly protein [Dethiosulfatarculus sandiegensis]KIX12003.1 hypothetical protein X474_21115 [Dethiosulfatarculus sandiegensis]
MGKQITLKRPINLAGQTVRCLEFRRPLVADFLAVSEAGKDTGLAKDLFLAARLSGCSEKDLALLDMADFLNIQKTLLKYLD